jgi:nucleotide-binding universal stress UspA family protein
MTALWRAVEGLAHERICGEDPMATGTAHRQAVCMNKPAIAPRIDRRTGAPPGRPDRGRHRGPPRPRRHATTTTRDLRTHEPGAGRPAGAFSSVLCVVDRSAGGRAAHDHAKVLAAPGGTLELVHGLDLTEPDRALQDACEGHDLLVLGARTAAFAVVAHAPIPVLLARWCPLGTEVADNILVPVDDSPESGRAVALAGRIAAAHGGTVTILGAPPRDAALQRALAASGRVLLALTGAAPRHFGDQLPREQAVPSAAAALSASLVVLGSGSSEPAKRMTAQIAARVGCSVLAVPTIEPTRTTERQP